MSSSWLAGCIRRRLPAGTGTGPVSLRESLEGLLTDPRKPRGKRHPLPSPVSVMVAGVASGHGGAQAVAQAASWDQDVLAGHGCRISPAPRGRARGGPGRERPPETTQVRAPSTAATCSSAVDCGAAGSCVPLVTQCRPASLVVASRTGWAWKYTSVPRPSPSGTSHSIRGAVSASPLPSDTNRMTLRRHACTAAPAGSDAGLPQRAAALALLAGALLGAGRAEPGEDVPFAVAETAAPGPHPAASTHPATIAITRDVLMTIMTAVDGIRLPSGAGQLSSAPLWQAYELTGARSPAADNPGFPDPHAFRITEPAEDAPRGHIMSIRARHR